MSCKNDYFSRVISSAVIGAAILAGSTSVEAKGPPPKDDTVLLCPTFISAAYVELQYLCEDIVNAYEAVPILGSGEKSLSLKDRNGLIVKTMSTDEKLLSDPPKYVDALEKVMAIQETICQLVQESNTGNLPEDCGGKKAKVILEHAEMMYESAGDVLARIYELMMPPAVTVTELVSSMEVIVTEVVVTEPITTETATTETGTTETATTETATTETATTETATTELVTTETATTEAATTEPTITEPTITETATTEPATTEPATTEAATTEAATTEAATTEPATTEPATTTEAAAEEPSTTL